MHAFLLTEPHGPHMSMTRLEQREVSQVGQQQTSKDCDHMHEYHATCTHTKYVRYLVQRDLVNPWALCSTLSTFRTLQPARGHQCMYTCTL